MVGDGAAASALREPVGSTMPSIRFMPACLAWKCRSGKQLLVVALENQPFPIRRRLPWRRS
jgi:hypothetical protein